MLNRILFLCLSLVFLGAGCIGTDESNKVANSAEGSFQKKAECGARFGDAEKMVEAQSPPGTGSYIQKICYSLNYDTCVLEYKFFFDNDNKNENLDWIDVRFLDVLTNETLISIRADNIVESYSEVFLKRAQDARDRINCLN